MKHSRKAIISLLVFSLTLVGLLLISVILGYRYLTVVSPSMGETAPVGSLVVTTNKIEDLSIGDIVSYHRGSRIYTHRIVEIDKDRNYITKGDLNSVNDSVPLKRHEIIGKSIFIGKYLGWIWSALPILLIGMVVVYFISCLKRIKDEWRWPVRIVGYALVIVITTFIINPWLRVESLKFEVADKGVDISIVNTGVFPLSDDEGGRFYAGQVRTVHTEQLDDKGRFIYLPRPSLGFWGVVFVIIWCMTPTVMAMLVRIPLGDKFKNLSKKEIDEEKTRNIIIFIITLIVSVLITAFQVSTLAAFTAVVSNDGNTLATNEYFTCEESHSRFSNPRPYLAYSLTNASSAARDTDLSGNGRKGVRTGNFFNSSSANGVCARDRSREGLRFSPSYKTCIAHDKLVNNPNTFSLETWFRTSVRDNSKMIGFGNQVSGDGGYFVENGGLRSDRHVYIHNGVIHFGLYPNRVVVLRSQAGKNYADNQWHHLVVTTSPSAGTKMYVDGELASENSLGGGQNYNGYWKIGCGRMGGWVGATGGTYHGAQYYEGDLRDAAIYEVVLTAEQVSSRYRAGI